MIENTRSITMDHVKAEVLDIVDTIIVKLEYIAEREDTLEFKRSADEYMAAITMNDNFHTYTTFSEYALTRSGLDDIRYKRDKFLIPKDKREEVVIYQREYVLSTYEEKNNYYRMLAGLPNYGESGIIINGHIPDVDTSLPVHEMVEDDITILKVTGVLSKLIKEYPEAKYLNYLDSERRISIDISRKARPFSILYIKRDRTKQGVSDSFISMYNQCAEYIQDRFYDDAYKHNSPYYDGFIGIFIMSTTIQRYITNYFHKLINRDFYDKDIIKLFLESYGIPYFDEIPLSYMQKVAKNLNRLLMYKATDKVFTDIFRIFDLDNIVISNYILLKDRNLDALGNPIEKYEERTELGYYIETRTDIISNDNNFCGKVQTNYNNIRNVVMFDEKKTLLFMNNGILRFIGFPNDMFTGYNVEKGDGFVEFLDETEFKTLYQFKNSKGEVYVNIITEDFKIYTVTMSSIIIDKEFPSAIKMKKSNDSEYVIPRTKSIILSKDPLNDNYVMVVNYDDHAEVWFKGKIGDYNNPKYALIYTFDDEKGRGISSIDLYDGSIMLCTLQGALWVAGKNTNDRLHVNGVQNKLIEVQNIIFVKVVKIFDKGSIFIINDGTVRYTGFITEMGLHQTDYCENNIIPKLNNIKTIKTFSDGSTEMICIYQYNDYVRIYNYSYSNKYGSSILSSDIQYPECKYRFVKDIFMSEHFLIVTRYKPTSYISYSGTNNKRQFPFIRTMSMIEQFNDFDIEHVEIFDDKMYFIANNKMYVNTGKGYEQIILNTKQDTTIQQLTQYGGYLIILTGTHTVYIMDKFYRIIELRSCLDMPIIGIIDGLPKLLFTDNKDSRYQLDLNSCINEWGNGISGHINLPIIDPDQDPITPYCMYKENEAFSICAGKFIPKSIDVDEKSYHDNTHLIHWIKKDDVETVRKIMLSDKLLPEITRLTMIGPILLLEGKLLYYIKIEDILNYKDGDKYIEVYLYDELNDIRGRSERIDGDIIIYNKNGGITIFGNFKHIDKLECDVVNDTLSLYDADTVNVKDIAFNGTDLIKIHDVMEIVTYEPIVNEMYNLKFVEVPIDTKNLGAEMVASANYLDYEMVVHDDKLWGGDGEKDAFVKEVLNSEFNYIYSKYISVNSKYNLTQLNFELCYMFKMLVDLKDNEKYLSLDVPYVGEVNLFDCIVGLFAITCIKFDFSGDIMDTTTKTMSVLGFNFNQDMQYITDVIDKANLYERDPKFKKEDIEIFRAPKLFSESPEVINLYLDNRDIMDNIYDYKYNASTIQEYNAYKRIADASIITNYNTDMYRIDGELPKTYLAYLERKHPKLCEFVKETDPSNMVQQIDILLVALDTYLKTDKLQYLFLNIPSLSMDNIRKFVYYLVDIFKSYTVDLKALNIIYHVDDKRIHNIKLILEEENFIKYFEEYEHLSVEDIINYTFAGFGEFERVKLKCSGSMNGNLPLEDYMLFNNKESFDLIKVIPIYESLKTDFMDFFEEMEDIIGYKQLLELIHRNILSVSREIKQVKFLNKDHFTLLMGVFRSDSLGFKLTADKYNTMNIDEKIMVNIIYDILTSYNTSLNIETNIKIKDFLESSNMQRVLNDIIPFDMYDNISYIESLKQQDTNINYKDKFYFIRKG